ncbi:hypothetical protein ACFLQ8_01795 [Candidatus Auribacterota bacterium]
MLTFIKRIKEFISSQWNDRSCDPLSYLALGSGKGRVARWELWIIFSFMILSLIYILPTLGKIHNYSTGDGESYQTVNAVINTSIKDYHQAPLWNPYSGGGNVLHAHPESNYLSPLYLPVLLLGVAIGVKVQAALYYFLGLSGMYLLCRYLNFKIIPSIAAAILFSFNSYCANHLNLGYFIWMTVMWLPWIFMFYLKSYSDRKSIVWCALVLALMLFEGGVHNLIMIMSFLAIFTIFASARDRCIKPILILLSVCGLFVLISGIKVFPMMEFLDEYSRKATGMKLPFVPYWTLLISLLDRGYYGPYFILPQPNFTSQEFGAYIGIIPFLVILAGSVRCFKKYWPIIAAMIIFVLISFGRGTWIDIWPVIKYLPGFNNQFITVRNVIIVVFCASLILGYFLSRFSLERLGNVLFLAAVIVVAADLIHLGWYYLAPFPSPPPKVSTDVRFVQDSSQRLYPTFLKGHGNLQFWRPARVPPYAKSIKDPGYRGEVYLLEGNGKAAITAFSPNRLKISYEAGDDDALVVNQNYFRGWHGSSINTSRVYSMDGLIAVDVQKGKGTLKLYYLPESFIVGIVLSFIGIIASILIVARKRPVQP